MSSERIPWDEAVAPGPGSSYAPGPPETSFLRPISNQKKPISLRNSIKRTESGTNEARKETKARSPAQNNGEDEWDPMKFDHMSKSFNSYQSGPGQLIETREQNEITLFVDRIPAEITKEGLRNLFSRAATVKRANIVPLKSGRSTTYGFVEFTTVRDAEMAIQMFNNKDIGIGSKLIVKVSESKANREDRMRKRKEDEEFYNSLHCARGGGGSDVEDETIKEDEAEKMIMNPLNPKYTSNSPKVSVTNVSASPGLSSPVGDGNSSALSAKSMTEGKSPEGRKRSSSMNLGNHSLDFSTKACIVCQTLTSSKCSRCKTPYCDAKCQRIDWPNHRGVCGNKKSSKPQQDVISPLKKTTDLLKIAEDSDEDGFVISCPTGDDLLPIKEVMRQVKNGNSLRNVFDTPSAISSAKEFTSTPVTKSINDSTNCSPVNEVSSVSPSPSTVVSSPITSFLKVSADSSLVNQMPFLRPPRFFSPLQPSSSFATSGLPDILVPIQSIYGQFESIPKPLPSLPLSSFPPLEFLAIVTQYYSSTQFSGIIPSVESQEALRKIRACAEGFVPGRVLASYLSEGSKCGYMDINGNLIRVQVAKLILPDGVCVNRYDFNGQCTVSAAELCYLPEDVVLIPSLLHKFILKDISVSNEGKADTLSACNLFRELVCEQPVLVHNFSLRVSPNIKPLLCSLKSGDGSTDICECLLRSPFVSIGSASIDKQSSMQFEDRHMSVQLHNKQKLNLSRLIPYHLVQVNSCIDILPTVVINPNIIWGRVLHPQLSLMEKMHQDMNTRYSPHSASSYAPVVGEICVAKDMHSQNYYRAEVLCVNHNGMVDIRFVESGCMETVTMSFLHHIEPVFLTLPKQARKFILAGIVPSQSASWSDHSIIFLKEKILNRKVSVKVIDVCANECIVNMYDPEFSNQLLNVSLVSMGHAENVNSAKQDNTVKCSSIVGVTVTNRSENQNHVNAKTLVSTSTEDSNPRVRNAANLPSKSRDRIQYTSPVKVEKEISSATSILCEPVTPQKIELSTPSPIKSLSGITLLDKATRHDRGDTDKMCSPGYDSCENKINNFLLPVGESFQVFVSEIRDPSKFYVQVTDPDNLSKVERTLALINDTPLVPMKKLRKGMFCLCRYDDDAVHRARIMNSSSNRPSVLFVDYGNIHNAKPEDVFEMSSEIAILPAQAVLCTINRMLNPAGKTAEWDKAATDHFRSLTEDTPLDIMVAKVVGHLHIVELTLSSSGNSKNMLLLMGHHCQMNNYSETKARTSPVKNVNAPGHHSDTRRILPPASASSDSLKSRNSVSISHSSTRIPYDSKPTVSDMCHPLVRTIERTKLPLSTSFKVMVTEVVSPVELYVQVADEKIAALLGEISEGINSLFETSPPKALSSAPEVGSLCCAKFSLDMQWYRVEVFQVIDGSCVVFFVDFGNKDTVPLSKMAACPDHFTSLPLVAVKCGMSGVTSDLSSITDFLKQHTSSSLLSARVRGEVDGTPQVELVLDGVNMLNEMKRLHLIKSPIAAISHPQVSTLERTKLPVNTSFKVMVTEIVSPAELYVQVADENIAALLGEISEGINSLFETSPPKSLSSAPEVGSLCCAKFSLDMQWYRVEVLQVIEGSCVVFFVDFGNKDTVPLSNMAACPDQFKSLPLVAVKCGMSGVTSDLSSITDFLNQHTSSSLLSARVLGEVDGTPQVELVLDGVNMLDEMKRLHLINSPIASISYPLVSKLERTKLPVGTTFKVMVTEVVSPTELYVQVADGKIAAILGEISEGINSLFGSNPPKALSSAPEIGFLCCAKFSLDMQWYRVEVLQVIEGSCVVFFVDFGNKDTVSLFNMAACPDQFKSLPLVAVKCGMSGVTSDLSSITDFLNQHTSSSLLSARVLGEVDGTPQVELVLDGVNMLDEMKRLHSINSPIAAISYPLVSKLERTKLPVNTSFKVMVTEIVSPAELYVQVADEKNAALLSEISEGINSLFETSPSKALSSAPEIGSLCCAKFSMDMQWYRVEVLQVIEGSCVVFFVDFGNKDTVPLSNMAACPDQFKSLPLVAVKCGMSGVTSDLSSITDFLKQHTSSSLLSARVQGEVDGTPQVELVLDGVNMLDEMKRLHLINSPIASISYPLVSKLERTKLPVNNSFKVMVTEIVSPAELYVQVADEKNAALLSEISEGINSLFETSPSKALSSAPEIGSLCCAKFSLDMQWYRVEVLQVVEGSCVVFFVDYGNKDTVPLSNMAACPDHFTSLPLVAVKCGMSGVTSDLSSLTDFLKQHTSSSLLSARVRGEVGGTPQVELVLDGVNMLDEMKRLHLINSPTAAISHPLVSKLEKTKLPVNTSFKVMVTEIVSLAELYVQVADEKNAALLSEISEGINSLFETSPPISLSSAPEVGSLCCGKFSIDMQWYRVEVLQIIEGSCVVFFVDYGNKDTVPLSNMAACPDQFTSLPLVAVKCGMSGVTYNVSKITDFLKQHTSSSLLSARVRGEVDGTPQVELVLDGVNVLDEMKRLHLINSPIAAISYPLVSKLERTKLPVGTSFKVMVTEVVSPTELYVQVADGKIAAILGEISEGINSLFGSNPPKALSSAPGIGSLCCAKFSLDMQWYRVEVLQVVEGSCVVFFVDYGNKDTVPLFNMTACPEHFTSLPLVAVECGMSGVTSDLSSLTDFLKKHTSSSLLSARVRGEVDGTPQVELVLDGVNMLDEMKRLHLINSPTAAISHPLVSKLERTKLPVNNSFKVMVTEIVSPAELYVQVADEKNAALLSEISEGINSLFETSPSKALSSAPEIGSLCCAKFSLDMQWYRVEVLQVVEGSCVVFFVDYGNKDTVPLSNMTACPDHFTSLPLVAVKCGMSGIPSKLPFMKKVISFLQSNLSNKLLSARTVNEIDGIFKLELVDGDVGIIENMTLLGLLTTEQILPSASSMQKLSLPEHPTLFESLVVEVVSLKELYVQISTQELTALLVKITDGIKDTFTAHFPPLLTSPPPVGSVCCSLFSSDSNWYRVEVKEIDQDTYKVFFLDFGSIDYVPLSSLAVCPEEYAHISPMAVKCSLCGISNTMEIASIDQAIRYVKSYASDTLLSTRVLSVENGIPQVEFKKENICLFDEMIQHGLVKNSHPLVCDLKTVIFPRSPDTVSAIVYEIVSLSELYLHVDTSETANVLSTISKETTSTFKLTPPVPVTVSPPIGSLCCAKYSEDNSWYRIELLEIKDNICRVLFIDYGSIESVCLSDIVPCPSKAALLPRVAIKCGLSGKVHDASRVEKMLCSLREKVANCLVSAKYVSEHNGIPEIELIKEGTSLMAELTLDTSLETPVSMVTSMKRLNMPTSNNSFKVMVCELNSPCELYVQFYDELTIETLSKITEGLKSHFQSGSFHLFSSFPSVGSLCCAKFSQDGLWYRARVDSMERSECKVFFIDYGNSDVVKLADMAVCPSQLVALPIISTKFALYGVDVLPAGSRWPQESIDALKTLTLNRILDASCINNSEHCYPSVQLIDNGTLISAKFLELHQSIVKKISVYKCQVTEISSLNSFYIQYYDNKNTASLNRLNDLQELYVDPSRYKGHVPTVGELCCAQYSGDKCWYRCRVMSVSTQVVKLFYIDFGNTENVLLSKVYNLDENFSDFPPLAVRCKLESIQPLSTSNEESVEAFKKLVDGVLLFVILHEEGGGCWRVSLYFDADHESSVASKLVSGYAQYV